MSREFSTCHRASTRIILSVETMRKGQALQLSSLETLTWCPDLRGLDRLSNLSVIVASIIGRHAEEENRLPKVRQNG